jgi:hypothetical protein
MIDVVSKRCQIEGCNTVASWGAEGTKQKLYCGLHGKMINGMEDVKNKKCEYKGCKTRATYGNENDGKALFCVDHKEDGMKDVRNRKCIHPGCSIISLFGHKKEKPLFCAIHKKEDMNDVVSRRCRCGVFIVTKYPFLCMFCNPVSTKRQRTREMTVHKLLESTQDLRHFVYNKSIGFSCGNFRPDFLLDAGTHYVIVECDEDQHQAYDPECERIRMLNILYAQGMRCVFIRYNPDAFKIKTTIMMVSEKKRHTVLLETIREHMKPSESGNIDVVYLYYDGAEKRTEYLK